jgi:nucleoid-associated protein YgaU
MQRIERYGVIALVFLLVTIVAVALWGQHDEQGLLAFMKKGRPDEGATASPGRAAQPIVEEKQQLPLTPPTARNLPAVWTRTDPGAGNGQQLEAALRERSAREAWRREQDLHGQDRAASPPAVVASDPAPAGGALGGPAQKSPTEPGPKRTVTVARGDTLGEIAQRELGTSRRWPEIAALNPGIDPNALRIGTVLALPVVAATPAKPASSVPGSSPPATARHAPPPPAGSSVYVVRAGDTLGEIARRALGTSTRWKEILELNPGLDPQRLAIGARLRLPTGATSAPTQERPLTVATAPKTAPTARELAQTGRRGGRVR